MNFHVGPGFTHHHDEPRVRHDHRVGFKVNHRGHVLHVVLDLVAVRKNIGYQVKAVSQTVGVVYALFEHV